MTNRQQSEKDTSEKDTHRSLICLAMFRPLPAIYVRWCACPSSPSVRGERRYYRFLRQCRFRPNHFFTLRS